MEKDLKIINKFKNKEQINVQNFIIDIEKNLNLVELLYVEIKNMNLSDLSKENEKQN